MTIPEILLVAAVLFLIDRCLNFYVSHKRKKQLMEEWKSSTKENSKP